MSAKDPVPNQGSKIDPVFQYAIRLLALALLLAWCFYIIQPFISIMVWAAVLSTTLFPLHLTLRKALKGRNGLSATIISGILFLIVVGPSVWLLLATAGEFKLLVNNIQSGDFYVPPAPATVEEWPLVGKQIYRLWSEASNSLSATIAQHQEEIRSFVLKILGLMKGAASTILFFAASIIVSGVLLAFAKESGVAMRGIATALAGDQGAEMADHAEITIRNVAKGILGVALLQSMLAGVGFVLAGIPFAGVWIAVCLILAIVQIGILPVTIGVLIYIWGTGDTTTAVIFTIWMILVSISDNVLKPMVMGKGAPVPTLVIFVGAIGGFLLSGIIGLFTGAIVLTLGYNLVSKWISARVE